jgi:HEAT repeat protein
MKLPWLRLLLLAAALVVGGLGPNRAHAAPAPAASPDLRSLAYAGNFDAIKALGPNTMPELVQLYRNGTEDQKASVAYVLYNLGWKSEPARIALMSDVHTENSKLRLQVQWALGRVSDDPGVVDVLLDNLQNDANPLFRDKAACALAYDQIHLKPAQKVRLYEGLIRALDDAKPDVRWAAGLALSLQTGQNKGFNANAPIEQRRQAIEKWQLWLAEYKSQL